MSALMAGIPGWFIPIVILLVSVFALTIILERGWLLLNRISLLRIEDQRKLLQWLREGQYEDAASYCRMQKHPAYKIVLAMIENKDGSISLDNIAEEESLRQMALMEKYLPTLGTISTVAPLLGLLGTVTGMIKSFRSFEQSAARSAQLMGGIDEALITTALGLVVAIPALIMYNYYIRRVNTFGEESEILTQMVLAELQAPESKPKVAPSKPAAKTASKATSKTASKTTKSKAAK